MSRIMMLVLGPRYLTVRTLIAEPSGAAGAAGVRRARETGLLPAGSHVAVLVTGNGLKDPGAVLRQIRIPDPVSPESAP